MIMQVHTSEGIVDLDTDLDSDQDFIDHGLTKEGCIYCGILDGCRIRVYSQDAEPTLGDQKFAVWVDTNDSNKAYLIYRRGEEDQVSVELV